jgi:hypothetical protein
MLKSFCMVRFFRMRLFPVDLVGFVIEQWSGCYRQFA